MTHKTLLDHFSALEDPRQAWKVIYPLNEILLGPGARLFGAFAAITGLLAFGLSTAFLVALMSRMFRDRLS